MPEYKYRDRETGEIVSVERDTRPSNEELDVIFNNRSSDKSQQSALGGPDTFVEQRQQQPSGSPFVETVLDEAPQMIGGGMGGYAGAVKGAALTAPLGPVGMLSGTLLGGAIGAYTGGFMGETFDQIYKNLTGNEKAPKTTKEALAESTAAGYEEAMWDFAGGVGARIVGNTFKAARPTAIKNIEKLNVKLQSFGGNLPVAKLTDNWQVHQLDSFVRGSLTGSAPLKELDRVNEEAIQKMEKYIRAYVAGNTDKFMSDADVGNLFLNTVKGGKEAHKAVVSNLYSQLDEMVPSQKVMTTVYEDVPNPVMSGSGKTTKRVAKQVEKEVKPVSMLPLKNSVSELDAALKRINYVGESSESKSVLSSLESLDDTLSFGDSQVLRSNLLDLQRNLKTKVGASKVSKKINTIVDQITKSMDVAAQKQGDEVAQSYAKMKEYARKGNETFNTEFLSDMIVADKKNPERIAEHVFRTGNVEEIKQVKRALRASSAQTGDFSYDTVWPAMQAHYLDTILRRSSRQLEVGIDTAASDLPVDATETMGKILLKEFTDPKKSRTLEAVFGKEKINEIKEFAQIAERVQKKPEGGLGMLANLMQAGSVAAAFQGAIEPVSASTTFITPIILGRILTSKDGTKLLKRAAYTPINSKEGKKLAEKINRVVIQSSRLAGEGVVAESPIQQTTEEN